MSGFTEQNPTQLTELHNRHKDKGFEILHFHTTNLSDKSQQLARRWKNLDVTHTKSNFQFSKRLYNSWWYKIHDPPLNEGDHKATTMQVCINGQETPPLYKHLKARKTGFLGSRIKWNSTKFLVDKEGRVINSHGTTTPPLAIEEHIQKALRVA